MDAGEFLHLHPRLVDAHYDTTRAYVAVLFRVLPSRVLVALGLVIGIGVVEWLGLILLVPLMDLVGLNFGDGTASRIAVAIRFNLARIGLVPTLATVLLVYVAVAASRALLQNWQSIAITDLQSGFARTLRRRLFGAIVRTRWIFFSRTRSSAFVHSLMNEVNRVGYAADHLFPLISQVLIVVVYLLFAFTLSPMITLLVFTAGLGLLLALRPQARSAFATGDRMMAASAFLHAAAMEQLSGLKTVRSYRAEDQTDQFFDHLQGDVVATQMAAQRNFARVRLCFEVGSAFVLSVMLLVSVNFLALPVAEVLLLIYLFGRVVPRLSGLQQSYQYFVNALPAFRNVMRMIDACEAEAEPMSQVPAVSITLNQAIRLRGVSFAYRVDAGRSTIQNLDLDIPAHRTTAIVGPSGAGKTTIADLVLGLIAPLRGEILVDGHPLDASIIGAWRNQIGYVAQEAFLFHDTIRANLRWARPDATEEELREALRLASADRFVHRLPRGLDTVVGDRGGLLAGGERQRLALARALLRRPLLLILDEATSSLDSENERQIQRAIEHLHGTTTILVITHRLATIREADAIHVVEDGQLVESGSWAELVCANGRFVDLCRAQRITTRARPWEATLIVAAGS